LTQVETITLIEELQTDGHSPMKFICSDGSMYFVKYRSGKSLDKNEINCLVFEMVCTTLLQKLHIPVPEQALVTINENSYFPNQLVTNRKYIKGGVIAWGSKEITHADLVKEAELIQRKNEFNKLANPGDFIKIALFDIWVDNVDRHSDNYNLLTKMGNGKLDFIAIDHAFSFGGLKGMKIFNSSSEPSTYKKLMVSQYFNSVVKHIDKSQRLEIAGHFLSLLTQLDIENIINGVFTQIPSQWDINPTLKNRVIEFLQSGKRIKILEQICKQRLQKNFGREKS
jgi:hypothetical protein